MRKTCEKDAQTRVLTHQAHNLLPFEIMSKALMNSLRLKAADQLLTASSPTKRKRSSHCFVLKDDEKDIVMVVATSEFEHRDGIRDLVSGSVSLQSSLK